LALFFYDTTSLFFILIYMFERFCVFENVDLSQYSTIKIGGRAKWLVLPNDENQFVDVWKEAKENGVMVFVLGSGSNTLFDEEFFEGVVVSTRHLDRIEKLGLDTVFVGAGVNAFLLNRKLKEWGLGGMEWSYGIPASFGGLVYMNAGAFGSEIKDVLKSVLVFDGSEIVELNADELHFSYRNSNLGEMVVLGGKIGLISKDKSEIERTMNDYLEKRKLSQPYNLPSLGSVFKRVMSEPMIYPAKLIDTLGLKGVKIGGAEVSKKHAGFIVNSGNATAEDFARLVELVEEKVFDKFKIKLEREVVFLSEKEKQ